MNGQSKSRPRASVVLALALLVVVAALVAAACGGTTTTATPAASVTPSQTPSATPSSAFEPWPPGTASGAQALAVADAYAARAKAETLASAHLLAANSTMDVWIADDHLKGKDVVDYFAPDGATTVLDWSGGTVFATKGAAAFESTVTNVTMPLTMRTIDVLTISNGKVTHQEVYGNGAKVARPIPVATRPGAGDTAAAAEAAVNAYYGALAKGDVTAATALYSPQVVFQDTAVPGKAGGTQQAVAWHTKLAAVPNMSMELKSLVAGKGWAVARWLLSGQTASGNTASVPGATLFEVRDGKIVRQTLYYSSEGLPPL